MTGLKGSYEKTISGILLSKEHGLPVTVVFVATKENYEELESTVEDCEKLGVNKMLVFTLKRSGRAEKVFEEQYVSHSELKERVEKANLLAKERNSSIRIILVDWTIEGQCVLLYPDGNVFATPAKEKGNTLFLGNLLTDSPKRIWEKFPYKEAYINDYLNH